MCLISPIRTHTPGVRRPAYSRSGWSGCHAWVRRVGSASIRCVHRKGKPGLEISAAPVAGELPCCAAAGQVPTGRWWGMPGFGFARYSRGAPVTALSCWGRARARPVSRPARLISPTPCTGSAVRRRNMSASGPLSMRAPALACSDAKPAASPARASAVASRSRVARCASSSFPAAGP